MAIRRAILAGCEPDEIRGLPGDPARDPSLTVVASATTADGVLSCLQTQPPDLLLFVRPQGFPNQGLDLTQAVRQQFPTVELAIVADRDEIDLVLTFARIGISAYFRGDDLNDLTEHLEAIGADRVVGGRRLVDDLAQLLQTPLGDTPLRARNTAALDGGRRKPRRCTRLGQILELVARGQTNKEVGRQLGIARSTVAEHLKRASATTGVSSRAALVRLWLEGHLG